MMTRCGRRRFAFTLIEILVVVAIIALLVAILLPSLAKAREQGRQAVCGSNNKQIGIAMRMFAEEHKEYYPEMYGWFCLKPYYQASNAEQAIFSSPYKSNDPAETWPEGHILKYVGMQGDVFLCPSDDGVRESVEGGPHEAQPPGHGNYSMQKDLQEMVMGDLDRHEGPFSDQTGGRDPMHWVWFKESNLMSSPSRVLMLMEQGGNRDLRIWQPFNDVTVRWNDVTLLDNPTKVQDNYLTDRHSKRGHLLFFDGHVDAILSDANFNGVANASTPGEIQTCQRAAMKAGYAFDRLYTKGGFTYMRTGLYRSSDDPEFK